MNEEISDTKLIAGKSFEELAEHYEPQLKSFLYRLTGSREDAEDLTQETLLKVYLKGDSFKGASSFKTWLFAIASNLAKDHSRSKKAWPVNAQDECKKTIGTTPQFAKQLKTINRVSEYGRYEIREHIDFCFTCIMKTLPIEQHLTLMLADIYSFKIKEIAEIMDLTAGVIKHHLHNARTTMQKIFEHRCALINKNGICHQCSELNGFSNTKAETQRIISEMEIVKASQDPGKNDLFLIRTELIKGIDPLRANGTDLHDFLMKHTRNAAEKE